MDDIGSILLPQWKANEKIAPTAKLSINAQMVANEKQELEDVSGLEVEFKKSFVGLTIKSSSGNY